MFRPARVHQEINAIVGGDFIVMVALRTDLKVGFEILLPERFLAPVAFDPQAFRNHPAFIGGLHRLSLALEPAHKRLLTIQEVPLLLGEVTEKREAFCLPPSGPWTATPPTRRRARRERPYSREPQAEGAVYDRPGFFVQSRSSAQRAKRHSIPVLSGYRPY